MARYAYIILFLLSLNACFSQIINQGGSIVIEENAVVLVQSFCHNLANGDLKLDGQITLSQDLLNEPGGVINGSGIVRFTGNQPSHLKFSGDSLTHVILDKTNSDVELVDHGVVIDSLIFSGINTKMVLNDQDLMLLDGGAVEGASSDRYINANMDGSLSFATPSTGTYVFPIGDENNFLPCEIDLRGGQTSSNSKIAVSTTSSQHPFLRKGITDYLKRYWKIDAFGISNYDAFATAKYHLSDVNGNADLLVGQSYASGTGWSQKEKDGDPLLQTVSVALTRVSEEMTGANVHGKAQLSVWLQGPYHAAGDSMRTLLNKDTSGQQINILETWATTCPYDPSITVPAGFFIQNPSIVDWIMLQTRNALDSTLIIDSIYGFVTQHGELVDLDGETGLIVVDHPDEFWVTVHHRNHFSVTSNAPIQVSDLGQVTLDFTSQLSQAWEDPLIFSNEAMTELESGVWGMTRADVDKSGVINVVDLVKTNAATSPNQSNIYLGEDINLDGITNVVDLILAKAGSSPNQSEHVPK